MVVLNYKYRSSLLKTIIGVLMLILITWFAKRSKFQFVRLQEKFTTAPGSYYERYVLKEKLDWQVMIPITFTRFRFKLKFKNCVNSAKFVWTKHGYLCFSSPNSNAIVDLTICMDVESNPRPEYQSTNSLHVLYLNARTLKDTLLKVCKITLLQQLVHSGVYDVVCICETWLNDDTLDSEILPGYNLFRKDRLNKIGGDVLIAVKSELEASFRTDLERPNCELVVVQLRHMNSKPRLFFIPTIVHPTQHLMSYIISMIHFKAT